MTGLWHVAMGLVLSAFPVPYWVWGLAIVSVCLQTIALAGPQRLSHLRGLPACLVSLTTYLGAGGAAAALAIALNHAGSDDLESLVPFEVVGEILQFALVALGLAALCASLITATGDRLLNLHRHRWVSFVITSVAILGLALGGSLGLLIFQAS